MRLVSLATDSERRRQSNPRKAYPVDGGLVRAFERSAKAQTEHLLETAVERRGFNLGYVVTESGFEVDVLATGLDGSAWLVQVTADAEEPGVLESELRALQEARTTFPEARCLLLTLGGTSASPSGPVEVQPAWRWLLADCYA